MTWILKTCQKCGEAGYALRTGSDAEKLTAHIMCLYCYNNLDPKEAKLQMDEMGVWLEGDPK